MTVRDDLRIAIAVIRADLGEEHPHLRWLLGEVERHLDLTEPPPKPRGKAAQAAQVAAPEPVEPSAAAPIDPAPAPTPA